MRDYLPFLVAGLTAGSIYALAAMGLVVTYTTSGVFNFAHGAVGMLGAFIFYSLRVDAGWPTWLALAVPVLLVAPAVGVLIDRLLLSNLAGASATTYVVVSLGLLVALQGIVTAIYGPELRPIQPFLPQDTLQLPGVRVTYEQIIVVLIAAAAGVGLWLFFRRTHLGLQTRAAVDDRDLTDLSGTSPTRVTTFSWMLGTSFAALSAILLAPFIGIDAAVLTLLVVQAFGGAVVGRLTSLPLTYAGALGIGLLASLSTKWVAGTPSLAGLPQSIPFLVLFFVLVISPKGRFAEVTKVRRVARRSTRPRTGGPVSPVFLVAAVAAVLLPFRLSGSHLLTASATVIFLLIFSSLGLLVGLSRQVSLCHAVFVGLGATTFANLLDAHIPYLLALPLSALFVVPIGAIIAIPAIRLSGLFLALATFGFGILAESLLFGTSFGFGSTDVVQISRPSFARGDVGFYFLALAVVAIGVATVEIVRRTRLGRVLRSLADSPTAVESVGINPTASRVIVFCLSAFLAALSGGLLGMLYQSVNSIGFRFFQSLLWLTVLSAAGAASLFGNVLAALLLIAVPGVFTGAAVGKWQPVGFGVAAVLLAQTGTGLAGLFRRPDFARLRREGAWRLQRSPVAARRTELVTERIPEAAVS